MKTVTAAVVLVAALLHTFVPTSAAVIKHEGNGTHDYPPKTTAAGDWAYAEDATTVNLLTGGTIGGHLIAWNNSTVNVSGGMIGDDLRAYDKGTVNISGGTITGDLFAYNDSTVTVSGGTIGGKLQATNNSTVTVSGGTITGDLFAYINSTVTVSGGSFGAALWAVHDSTLTIIGSGFNFDYGNYSDGTFLDEQYLTGTLADGTPINNNQVKIYSSGTVTLAAIPEPGIALLLSLGCFGMSVIRRR